MKDTAGKDVLNIVREGHGVGKIGSLQHLQQPGQKAPCFQAGDEWPFLVGVGSVG